MGDFNQLLWVKKNQHLVKGSVLEVGSKFYDPKTSVDYRSLFNSSGYLGIDLEEGNNVDVVCDLTSDFKDFPDILKNKKYQTVICCSVMEHVKDIYSAANNISKMVESNGILFISVPFIWQFHGYPSDYWRFTPEALKFLFKDFDFDKFNSNTISSNIDHDIQALNIDPNEFLFKNKFYHFSNGFKNTLMRKVYRVYRFFSNGEFRKEYLLRKILKNEKRFPYTSINLIGVKN